MPTFFGFGSSKSKDNASIGSVSPEPGNSRRRDKQNRERISNRGMNNIHDYTSQQEPRNYIPTNFQMSNGHFMDVNSVNMNPEFVRSALIRQLEGELQRSVTKACLHYDQEALRLENDCVVLTEQRHGLEVQIRNYQQLVEKLEREVQEKTGALRKFQEGHVKSAGNRRLPPSTSEIEDDYKQLERLVKDSITQRVRRLDIDDALFHVLLTHKPFLEAVGRLLLDQSLLSTVQPGDVVRELVAIVLDTDRKALVKWMMQGVVHSILHKHILGLPMPGLEEDDLRAINKIYESIFYSEGAQGPKLAEAWRATTFGHLAYWAENPDTVEEFAERSEPIRSMGIKFGEILGDTSNEIFKCLMPFCDPDTNEGKSFREQITEATDKAFIFAVKIKSQAAGYALNCEITGHEADFTHVPSDVEVDESYSPDDVKLFYVLPSLLKTSNEDGERFEKPEVLLQGKIYVNFSPRGETEEASTAEQVQLASPVNGGEEDETSLYTKPADSRKTAPSNEASAPTRNSLEGADTLPPISSSTPNIKAVRDPAEPASTLERTISEVLESDTRTHKEETPEISPPAAKPAPGAENPPSGHLSQYRESTTMNLGGLVDSKRQDPQTPQPTLTPAETLEISEPSNTSKLHQSPEKVSPSQEIELQVTAGQEEATNLRHSPQNIPTEAAVDSPKPSVFQQPQEPIHSQESQGPPQTQQPEVQEASTPALAAPPTNLEALSKEKAASLTEPSIEQMSTSLIEQTLKQQPELKPQNSNEVAQSTPRSLPTLTADLPRLQADTIAPAQKAGDKAAVQTVAMEVGVSPGVVA